MGKWVLGLCVSLYGVLILFGGDGYHPEEVAEAEPVIVAPEPKRSQPQRDISIPEVKLTAAALTLNALKEAEADAEIIPAVATVNLDGSDIATPSESAAEASPAADAETETQIEQTEPVREIWTVTGNRVNLRDGASTQNEVVGQTVRGESAEILELMENGWARVFIIERGIEAFMSAQFIAPEQG